MILSKEALINCLHKQIAALSGAQKLAYLFDMSRFLRSIRLALCLFDELFSTSLSGWIFVNFIVVGLVLHTT